MAAAEVGWRTKSGARKSMVVPMRGRVVPGSEDRREERCEEDVEVEAAVQVDSCARARRASSTRCRRGSRRPGATARAAALALEGRADAADTRGHAERCEGVGERSSVSVPQESRVRNVTDTPAGPETSSCSFCSTASAVRKGQRQRVGDGSPAVPLKAKGRRATR